MTSVEAQNHFGELLDTAQHEPVTITRQGNTLAYVVSAKDMAELIELRNRRSELLARFESYFAETDSKLKPDAFALTDSDVNRLVHELR